MKAASLARELPLEPVGPRPPRPRRSSGVWGALTGWLVAWRENRHAVRTSRTVLALYRRARDLAPEMGEREVFLWIVMSHAGLDERAAESVLQHAEESFSAWPVCREVTLCDIIHYLTFDELLAEGTAECWIHSDLGRTIQQQVPRDLCLVRPRD